MVLLKTCKALFFLSDYFSRGTSHKAFIGQFTMCLQDFIGKAFNFLA